MEFIKYSDRSYAMLGNTKPHKEILMSLGFKFNPRLTDPDTGERVPGWIVRAPQATSPQTSPRTTAVTSRLTRRAAPQISPRATVETSPRKAVEDGNFAIGTIYYDYFSYITSEPTFYKIVSTTPGTASFTEIGSRTELVRDEGTRKDYMYYPVPHIVVDSNNIITIQKYRFKDGRYKPSKSYKKLHSGMYLYKGEGVKGHWEIH